MKTQQTDSSGHMMNRGFGRGFWGTLITLMFLVGGLELYGALSLHQQITDVMEPAGSRADPHKQATLSSQESEGEPSKMRSASWRERLINETFKSASDEYSSLIKDLRTEVKNSFRESRRKVDSRVDDWADWYFSVIGEYARLGHLGAQAIGKSTLDEYMIEQLSKRVFGPAEVFEDLASLNQEVERRFSERHKEVISHLERMLRGQKESKKKELSEQERLLIEEKLSKIERLNHVATVSPLALAAKLTSLGGVKAGLKFLVSRSAMKAATAGGAKVAAAGGAKVAAAGGAKVVAASGAKLAAKGAVKVGAKAGQASALASGASAAALCSPLGPIAALCGVTAGVVTWFAVDKAIVEIDELMNREDFVRETRHEFTVLMNSLEGEVLNDLEHYHSQVIELMVSDQEEHLDTPPKSTRLVDQIQTAPKP